VFFSVLAAIVSAGAVRAPADTIYSLAVDSTKYRTEPFVYLLDDGVLRVESDGRGSRTYRQVVQILKFGEFSLAYAQEGRILTVIQRRAGRKGILPPERVDDLVRWLEQVSAASRESDTIVLSRAR
jgi:hypothetical protein